MPYINTVTTKKISPEAEAELIRAWGEAIEIIPGKCEEYLMLNFTDNARMAFKGSKEDCAILEVEILGKGKAEDFSKLADVMIETINRVLGVPKERVYVKYAEVDYWYAG